MSVRYVVKISDVTNVGTAYDIHELPKILKDGGCVKKMTVELMMDIIDTFDNGIGRFIGRCAENKRYYYTIEKVVN